MTGQPLIVLVHGAFASRPPSDGSTDLSIDPAKFAHRFAVDVALAERAGARGSREISGASHAVAVSQPATVAETILEAVAHVR
jgi:hypothetical protein